MLVGTRFAHIHRDHGHNHTQYTRQIELQVSILRPPSYNSLAKFCLLLPVYRFLLRSFNGKLTIVQFCVKTVQPEQFVMRSLFNNSALLHDKNQVGIPDG